MRRRQRRAADRLAAEEAARIAAEESALAAKEAERIAAEEAERIAVEEKRQAEAEAEAEAERVAAEAEAERAAAEADAQRATAEAEAARIAAEEEAKRLSDEEQAIKDTEDTADGVEKESKSEEEPPKVVDPEENTAPEPTLGDVENIKNQAATKIVEGVAKAAKDIVVNIIEATQDTEEGKADTAEEARTSEEKVGG